LLNNIQNFPDGPLHLDNTYHLIKNGFPVCVLCITDKQHTIHPIGFALLSREQEKDFNFVFESLKVAAELIDCELNIE
jgi:hypothetical protein